MNRTLVKNTLKTVIQKESNINTLEEIIYQQSQTSEIYYSLTYEVVGLLLNNNKDIKKVIDILLKGKIGFDHSMYDQYKQKKLEQDEFATQPINIEEGVIECTACGSKRTLSYQKQTRSADEGSTTFSHCVDCNKRWKHNC
jgi:DNA-directed RNA polymerase subunit M/transcription elongation factor TFIIS